MIYNCFRFYYHYDVSNCYDSVQTCAGGVVIKSANGTEPQVLLIKVNREDGRVEWLLPKGHLEREESLGLAAIREICEETGLLPEHLNLLSKLGDLNYSYKQKDLSGSWQAINKTVHFFLYELSGELSFNLYPAGREGIVDARFCSFPEAESLLSFDGYRSILAKAIDFYSCGRGPAEDEK